MAKSYQTKAITVLAVLAYCITYFWVYNTFVVPTYEKSEDYSFIEVEVWNTILTIIYILVPLPQLNSFLKKPSQAIIWIIYILVYIPLLFMPYFNGMQLFDLIFANTNLMFGFILLILFSKGNRKPVLKIQYPYSKIRIYLYIVSAIMVVATFYHHRSELRFANPFDSTEVYSQRLDRSIVSTGIYAYLLNWIASVFTPIFVASGLFFRKKIDVVYGVLICLLAYMVGANKIFLLAMGVTFLVYFAIKKSYNFWGVKILTLLAILMILTALVADFFKETEYQFLASTLAMIVTIRTVGISTYNYKYYYDFFITNHNPKTYLSHNSVVNLISDSYPYKYSLGQVMGDFYFNKPEYELNSNFFITDGLCSFGLYGFIFAGILCGFMLRILDNAAQNHKLEFSVGLTFYAAMSLANISLFTVFITGGLGFIIIYLYVLSPTHNSMVNPKI